MIRNWFLIVTISLLSLSQAAFACGDSLYRAGKGVAYRTYTAPLPGNLLVIGESEYVAHIVEDLRASGHNVRHASDTANMRAVLEEARFDAVLASSPHRERIEAAVESSRYVEVTGKRSIKHYLKTIHKILKRSA